MQAKLTAICNAAANVTVGRKAVAAGILQALASIDSALGEEVAQ